MERQAPHNTEAEQLLIGSALINNQVLDYLEDLEEACFYHPIHRKIFAAIKRFHAKSIVATPVTLKNMFENENSLEEVGGSQYLVQITSKASTIIDPAGIAKIIKELHLKRNLIAAGEAIVNKAYDKENIEAIKQLEEAEASLFSLATLGELQGRIEHLSSPLNRALETAEFAFNNKGSLHGMSTGFVELDKLLGGLQKSDLLVLAGRPSMGKTALAINMALNASKKAADSGQSVAFLSLEMSSEQLALRLISMETGINSSRIKSGFINSSDLNKIVSSTQKLSDLPLFIDDTPALSINGLSSRIRRICRKNKLSILFIDYLQLLRGNQRNDQNRVQEISEVTQGLKALAKELNIPIVALSQLSRSVEQREDKRPQLSDLRESGSIEQDADVVMFIFREAYYLMRKQPEEGTEQHMDWQRKMEDKQHKSDIIIAKQRNGPIGNVSLYFDINTTRFNNLSKASEFA